MEILRYTAFSTDPAGGNPAGVVLDATGASDAERLAVAAELGYSETAFLEPLGDNRFTVRYFSPLAEVPFCGHATIASAAAYAERHGPGLLKFQTRSGLVEVSTALTPGGATTATLVSVAPHTTALSAEDLSALLAIFGWNADDLDPALPPRVAYAGAEIPVLGAATRQRLAVLDYDLDVLAAFMAERGWVATVALVWRESATVFHARNPFPPGGVVEDPATGAAAAALGGYLRELGLVDPPTMLTIHQGADLGRPSLLTVGISAEPDSGIAVSGSAVPLSR